MSHIPMDPRRNRNRSPFNAGSPYKLCFKCDECGVLFARSRSAKRSADMDGCVRQFCSRACNDLWHTRNAVRENGKIIGYRVQP